MSDIRNTGNIRIVNISNNTIFEDFEALTLIDAGVDGFRIQDENGNISVIPTSQPINFSINQGKIVRKISILAPLSGTLNVTAIVNDTIANTYDSIINGIPYNLLVTSGILGIDLSWTRGSTNEDGSQIWYSINGGPYLLLATVGNGVSSYTDVTSDQDNTIDYKVRSFKGGYFTGFSNIAVWDWQSYWTPQSYVVENAAPTDLIVTYAKKPKPADMVTGNFAVSGNTISSITLDGTGKIATFVLGSRLYKGDTPTLTSNSIVYNITNNTTLYQLPSRNSDIVQWNSLQTLVTSGIGDYGAEIDGNGTALLNRNKGERITGYSTITKVKFHNKTKTNIAFCHFYVWSWDQSVYFYIEYDEDILAKISTSDEIQTITLATPVTVQEGWFVGICWHSSSGSVPIAAAIAASANSSRVWGNTPVTHLAWDVLTPLASMTVIQVHGQAPMIICIGDSISESSPWHSSMVAVGEAPFDPTKSWIYQIYNSDNRFIYQNCGNGTDNKTADVAGNFDRDIVAKKPKFVCIDGGVNDINTSVLKAAFIANWTSILDKCNTNGITPIVFKIMPWTNGTNTQMQTRDDWNASLVTLFNSYSKPNWIIIDFDSDLGQFRAGGDAGNLWDIKTAYNQDGVHYTEAGYTKISQVVLTAIGNKYVL
jgi:hypothetical protein